MANWKTKKNGRETKAPMVLPEEGHSTTVEIVAIDPSANGTGFRVVAPERRMPLPRLRTVDERHIMPPPGYRRELGEFVPYCRSPSIVQRLDGRYGVARAMRYDEGGREMRDAILDLRDSSRSSGFVHEKETYATRLEAEKHAWALARKIGTPQAMRDWP